MGFHTHLGVFTTSILAAVGIGSFACGGSTTGSGTRQGIDDAGAGGASAGGASGGRTPGAGGAPQSSGGQLPSLSGGNGGEGPRPPDAGAGGFTVEPHPHCLDARPQLDSSGRPSGFVDCQGGAVHRAAAIACARPAPRDFVCPATDASPENCKTDTDCTQEPNGYCDETTQGTCFCQYGCRTDADCAEGWICRCGDPFGACVYATCRTDADCGAGSICLDPSGNGAFSCTTPQDDCRSDPDCGGGTCYRDVDAFRCDWGIAVDGRPFLVGGAARVAAVAPGADWLGTCPPCAGSLDDADRAAAAAHWLETARMEHASIAAFARFVLELLSLGAPPDLVLAANQAIVEETAHARDAFALASRYLGRSVGPGVLDVTGALEGRTPESIVRSAILEGCIGETVAAIEAAESLAEAKDPAVRAALERVAREEKSHAELAFRFVHWVMTEGPPPLARAAGRHLVDLVEAELRRAPMSAGEPDVALTLVGHGVLGAARRERIRATVLRDVVLPCAREISSSARRTRGAHPASVETSGGTIR